MHQIHIHSTSYSIPSKWDELSGKQLKRIAWLSTRKLNGLKLTKLFFYILTMKLPFWKRVRLQYFYLIQAGMEERGDFLTLVDNFHENRTFTSQLIPKLRIKRSFLWLTSVLLLGPDSKLANCTFWEFIEAERHYLNYLRLSKEGKLDQAKESLHRLIATLYRQRNPKASKLMDSDLRIPLNSKGLRWRLAIVSKASESEKIAILMWFEGCRNTIMKAFPLVFPVPSESEKRKPGANAPLKSGSTTQQWMDMISSVATSMSDYDKIADTNLMIALTDISHRIKNSKPKPKPKGK